MGNHSQAHISSLITQLAFTYMISTRLDIQKRLQIFSSLLLPSHRVF
jgi:hypothetical protein